MGAPLSGTDLRAYIMSGGGLTVAAITAMNYNEFWFDIGCDICWAKMPYHGTFVVAKGHDTFIVQKRAINYAFDQTWQDQYKDWK